MRGVYRDSLLVLLIVGRRAAPDIGDVQPMRGASRDSLLVLLIVGRRAAPDIGDVQPMRGASRDSLLVLLIVVYKRIVQTCRGGPVWPPVKKIVNPKRFFSH